MAFILLSPNRQVIGKAKTRGKAQIGGKGKAQIGMEDVFWHDCIFGKQVWDCLQNKTEHVQIA